MLLTQFSQHVLFFLFIARINLKSESRKGNKLVVFRYQSIKNITGFKPGEEEKEIKKAG